MWSAPLILSLCREALQREEQRRIDEQAVYGLESLEEVELHPILAEGALAAGFGALRERLFPAEWRRKRGRRRALPEHSERQRCDLVLTPEPGQDLIDPLATELEAERRIAALKGTLFEETVAAQALTPASGVGPEACYWLEIKLVGQFCYSTGIPGPNRAYSSELTRGVCADLRKLRDDPAIVHGGVLLVHFGAVREVAAADIPTAVHKCIDKGVTVRSPILEQFAVPDRIGNTVCTCALIEPVRDAESVALSAAPGR